MPPPNLLYRFSIGTRIYSCFRPRESNRYTVYDFKPTKGGKGAGLPFKEKLAEWSAGYIPKSPIPNWVYTTELVYEIIEIESKKRGAERQFKNMWGLD